MRLGIGIDSDIYTKSIKYYSLQEIILSKRGGRMSIYERIMKAIERFPQTLPGESFGEVLSVLERYLRQEKGLLLSYGAVQAMYIDQSDDYMVIEIYLRSIEIWIKIYKEGHTDVSIYPLLRCECGGG
jgi:hypothetical protein